MTQSSHYRTAERGPRHQPGSSGQDLGDQYVVAGGRGRWVVEDLSTGRLVGPTYLHHADAQAAADKRNPRRRPTTQQGDLFDTTQEA